MRMLCLQLYFYCYLFRHPFVLLKLQCITNNNIGNKMPKDIKFDGDSLTPEQLPIPSGWRILLAPIKITEETKGGIFLIKEDVKSQETVRFVSKVLAIGPLAYTGDKFKPHPNAAALPWCKVGDIVTTGQYAGSQLPCRIQDSNESFYLRLVNDDEIVSVVPDVEILNV